MFNWTTTTFINEIPDNFIHELGGNKLRIGKYIFEKRWVESIRKAVGHAHTLCQIKVDMETVKSKITTASADAKVARLYLYVGLEGSEEAIYANDLYRKGMPLSITFNVGNAATMASEIQSYVSKFNAFTKAKKILDVTASGSEVTITGTHEYQRIQKIAVLIEDPNSTMGYEIPVIEWTLSDARYQANGGAYTAINGITVLHPGANGFGTYSQLVKDLSLPTAVNSRWINVNERPAVGGIYNQYIINYYAPSTSNPSFTAVGNRSMSETTHVFWVKSELATDWEKAIAGLDPDGDSTAETPKFNTIVNPYVDGVSANKSTSLIAD
jgi:hypothetical protein